MKFHMLLLYGAYKTCCVFLRKLGILYIFYFCHSSLASQFKILESSLMSPDISPFISIYSACSLYISLLLYMFYCCLSSSRYFIYLFVVSLLPASLCHLKSIIHIGLVFFKVSCYHIAYLFKPLLSPHYI